MGLGLSVIVAYAGRRARARLWVLPLTAVAFASGIMAGPRPIHRVLPPQTARVVGRVTHVRLDRDADLLVESGATLANDVPLAAGARVRVRGLHAAPGDRVRALVRIRPATSFRNPSPHPSWEDGRRIDAMATLAATPRIEAGGWWRRRLHAARDHLRRRLDATLPPRAAGVARALLLGDGSAVDANDRRTVQEAGMAHLLAVSGLHVALFVGTMFLALGWLFGRCEVREPRRMAACCAIPLTCGFALMAGGAPSAWRAALMAVVAFGAVILRRRPRPVAVAALAVIVYAMAHPEDGARPGFLLSVLATASIVTHRPSSREERRTGANHERGETHPAGWETWRAAVRLSVRTTLATAPLVVWCFGNLAPLSVVANVVLLPVGIVALVPLAFAHALAAGVGLASWTSPIFVTVCEGLIEAAQPFGAGAHMPPPDVAQGVVLVFACFALLAARTPRQWAGIAVATLLALGGAELHLRHREQPRGRLRITMLDVGQGDGALVDLPDGRLMLIDAGGGRPDPGQRALLPLLRARRRTHVDLAVITHPHPDHYGGLRAIAKAMPIDEVWTSGQAIHESPHGPAAAMLRQLARGGTRVRVASRSLCKRPRRFGQVSVEVLWPCFDETGFDPGYEANDNSIVLRMSMGRRRFLFTGDVERLAEEELVRRKVDLRADWIKVPHHGSRTSSTHPFLAAVAPRMAVVSCGRQNSFGHPHPEVLARYEAHGVPLLRTDEIGGVVFESDGLALRLVSPLWPTPSTSLASSVATEQHEANR